MVDTEGDTLRVDDTEMGEGEASSTPFTTLHSPMPMARHHAASAGRQRASGRLSWAPSQAVSNGPLAAARELLRNPLAATASPDALRQWRDDVDLLLHLV